MRVLGLSAFYHDSAAALVEGGRIVAAAQEERFTRRKHDSDYPANAIAWLPRPGRSHARRDRPGGVLRQTLPQVRAVAGNLCRVCAARVPLLLHGRPGVDQGEAVPERPVAPQAAGACPGGGLGHPAAVRRAPPVARGERVLPLALSRRGGPDHGRGGRVGHHLRGHRPRQRAGDGAGDPLSAFPGAALLGVHLLHRLQGEFRRVQGDGPGPLRGAEVRPHHPRPPDRSQAGWDVPPRHRLLRLLHRADDDQRPLRRAVRRPGAQAGGGAGAAAHGSGRLGAGGGGGSGAAADALATGGDRHPVFVPRGRRRAQLRRQRQGAARRPLRRPLGTAGGRATPEARWAPRARRRATGCSASRVAPLAGRTEPAARTGRMVRTSGTGRGAMPCKAPSPAPGSARKRFAPHSIRQTRTGRFGSNERTGRAAMPCRAPSSARNSARTRFGPRSMRPARVTRRSPTGR